MAQTINLSAKQFKSLLTEKKKPPAQRRERSRSRSKSRPRVVKSGEFRSHVARVHIVKRGIAQIAPLITRLSAAKKKLALVKAEYFKDTKGDDKIDAKSLQTDCDQLQKELQLAVAAIKAGLGNRPIRMRLPASLTFTATVTTGVVNTVKIGGGSGAFDPSTSNEWSSVSALFDEYRLHGGDCHFIYGNSISPITNLTAAGPDGLACIGWEADSSSAASSADAVAQLAQHMDFSPGVTANTGNGNSSFQYKMEKFRVTIPKGMMIPPTPNGNIPADEWIETNNPVPSGYLKMYQKGGAIITADVVGAGRVYFDLSFRCRA